MKIQEYLDWKKMRWKELAKKIGVDPTYLSHIKHGRVRWTPAMAQRVEKATAGHVKKESLIWPE